MLDLLDEKAVHYSPVSAYYLDGSKNDELDIERRGRNDIFYNLDPTIDIDVVCEELLHKSDISDISIEKIIEVCDDNTERIQDSVGKYIDFIKQVFADVEDNFKEYSKHVFNATYNRLNLSDFINEETRFSKKLDNVMDSTERYEMVEKHCLDHIYDLRKEWYSLAETDVKKSQVEKEIRKMVLNIRNFRYATNNRSLNDIYTRLLSIDTLTLSTITILDNNQQSASKTLEMIDDNITNKKMLYDLYRIVSDPKITAAYKQRVEDIKTKWFTHITDPIEKANIIESSIKNTKSKMIPVAYSTHNGIRPHDDFVSDEAWNGFQAFDLDIKEASLQDKDDRGKKRYLKYFHDEKDVDRIKHILHERLKKYNWYLCTKTSISNKGLHILTKVKPMHGLYKNSPKNSRLINRFWFMMNYYHKYTIIRWILLNECGIESKYVNKIIDTAMMKIAQGIVLNSDTNALWNHNFIDLPQFYGYTIPPKEGLAIEDWLKDSDNLSRVLTKKKLKAVGHESLSAMRKKTHHTVDMKPKYDTITYQFSSIEMPNLNEVIPITEDKFQSGQRDMMRHKLMRTVIYLYGTSNDVKDLCRHLLKVPSIFSEQEFQGKWNYAHKKPFVFDDMLILLKASGCKFKIEKDVLEEIKDSKLHKAIESLKDTDVVFNEVMPDYAFELGEKKSYLGSVKDELLDALETDRVNVIESPPGTGKTTLFNILASEYTVCLVCPYVSVLKNKVENDLTASKLYDVCYDTKPITIERGKSVATTFDKFSQLTYDEYKNFDLIAIDESHLLFTSTYREAVTVKVANNISKFVTNEMALKERMTFDIGMTSNMGVLENTSLYKTMSKSGTKVVMMTGTITGELIYFKRKNTLNYLKINAKHKYGKHAEFVLCNSPKNVTYTLAQTIARALDDGKTVIFPTNRGEGYVESMVEQSRLLMKTKLEDDEWTYYKKSNSHHDICDSINTDSVLPDNARLLFCTVYLGVGVDILNERDYLVVFDGDLTTAQDIEQFNNRIRKAYIQCSIVYNALSENVAGIKEVKKSMYDTPSEIELKNVSEHSVEIADDNKIAQANARVTQSDEYARINLPENLRLDEIYHDITHEGAIFNEDKFLIRGFSQDYNKIASGAAYTKYVLTNYYDYSISYKVSIMDDLEMMKQLDEVSKEAKKRVILDKADAFLQTVYFCAENWEKLRNRNSIDFEPLRVDSFVLKIEDADKSREGKEDYDYTLKYSIAYDEHFNLAYRRMRTLLKLYESEDAIKFMESHVAESGRINYTELHREMRLINFIKLSRDKNMLLATHDVFKMITDFVNYDDDITHISDDRFVIGEYGMRSLRIKLNKYADKYFTHMSSEDTLSSAKRREEMFDKTEETIKTLFKVRKNKDGEYNASFRKIPKFSSIEAETNFIFDDVIKTFLASDIVMESDKVTINLEDYDDRKDGDYTNKVGDENAFEEMQQDNYSQVISI